jgi:fused signal recognition particle receptor
MILTSVVFDAIVAAEPEVQNVDHTAYRLQNKKKIWMDELSKIRRIVDKKAPGATVESLLVLTQHWSKWFYDRQYVQPAKLSGVAGMYRDGSAGVVLLAAVRTIGSGKASKICARFLVMKFVEALLDFRF